jgi:hypothetical protein
MQRSAGGISDALLFGADARDQAGTDDLAALQRVRDRAQELIS